jgi:hypothetical protein
MSTRFTPRSLAWLAGLVALGVGPGARANPRPLPFTYQSETLAKGAGEVEQFIDYMPTRVLSSTSGEIWYGSTQFQTEVEYGLTDRLELALYFTFVPEPSSERYMGLPTLIQGNGMKQRLRWRLADPQEWPIDVALYGEIAENEREIELEAKIILQRRFGRLRLITNLWAEREFYFDGRREWVLNPTAGATVELSERVHIGVEGWMRAEFLDGFSGPRPFNMGPHYYVGPAVLLNFGTFWWTTAAYWRADDPGRTTQVGDAYGPFWVRTVVGIGF